MKNLHLRIDFIDVNIVFIHSKKRYKKYTKKHNINQVMETSGMTTVITRYDNISFILSICKFDNIYAAKALIVHEISHIVTEIMAYFNFNCDETRSYLIQYIYQMIMPHYDKIVRIK